MAQIPKTTQTHFEIEALAPAGRHIATCLDINDEFGVQRPNFDNPAILEPRDVTRFLFGFRTPNGGHHLVESFEFRISGSPKANLIKFLASWLGRQPEFGWDYCELKGEGALIEVTRKASTDGVRTFANITAIQPVPDARKSEILSVETFSPNQK